MQIMFGTILCVLLKSLVLTKATFIPNDYTPSNSLQEESVSICPDLNLTQKQLLQRYSISSFRMLYFMKDISMTEKSDHYILNFKSDRSHSDSTVRNEREVDEVTLANISIIPESIESSLSKPISLRAFVQFDSQFTEKVNDIFVTLRWNQPEFNDEIILWYQVQCSFFEDFKKTCDDKNITATKLEHTVHNLTSNATYYFRVRAHTKIVVSLYTDLINVSTTHENPIPKVLVTTKLGMEILDVDLNITNFVTEVYVSDVIYSIQDNRIYWTDNQDLMTLKINENKTTKIASFDYYLDTLCIDWVARNLYFTHEQESGNYCIVKFELTMWEYGIIKFDEIVKSKFRFINLNVSPSTRILYGISYIWKNREYDIMKYHLDGKNEQIVRINASFCLFHHKNYIIDIIIDDMNNEEPLIYWLSKSYIVLTDINISMCNTIYKEDISDNIDEFISMTIDKTNIYIFATKWSPYTKYIYVLKKKYASLKGVSNAYKYVEKIILGSHKWISWNIYAFDKSAQPYPPMRCLTPDEKVYNFENVNAKANSISVSLPEPVVKSGCKKYNLPTTIYTISVRCLDNNLNKSEKFNVQTFERYYVIQNLTPFTEYKLKFTLSNFYFDQLSINPLDSNVIRIRTNLGKPNAPENISVLALTPTIAVVHWIPLEKVNCMAVTYEVHWNSVTLVNGTQQKSKQFINVQKRTADGRFFTKINLSLPVQDYLIYVRVYPSNFSDFYNESLSKIVHIYSEPNNITLSGVNINSMDISWISNVNLMVFFTLEYKEVATEKWQTTHYFKMNYNKDATYHIENLQSGTSYKFRLILRYPEYEEYFIWPADERFIFSTLVSERESRLNKPTSLRAFVQFDSQFTKKVNDIFVTLRWNRSKCTDEIIQGYTVQCFFEDLKENQICDKNITTLEYTLHNLKPNTTYYFQVRAYTKVVAGPYTDLINVSTIHENPIPKLLLTTNQDIQIWDVDLNTITNFEMSPQSVRNVAYSIQDNRIYWINRTDLMTLKINENNITKMASYNHDLHDLCIDWVARNLYLTYLDLDYSYIVKFDLTMWENGKIKFDEIFKAKIAAINLNYLNVSPSMGILYRMSYNWMNREYDMMKYHLDGKNEQIIQINASLYLFYYIHSFSDMVIDNMNNEESLIYWLSDWSYTIVTDINISKCNKILYKENISNDTKFQSITIDKTNIYILAYNSQCKSLYTLYVLKKKYANLKSVPNAYKYVEKISINSDKNVFHKIYAFDKSLQPYPPMRCLTPDEKVYNFENVNATANSIIVNLPEPVVKSGCKKYNLPTTVYTISVSHCLDNNLNKSEKFNVLTAERYYEIQNLIPFTEYKLKFTLSNFYFDQLSINPIHSNVISIKTNSGKLNAPENISVLGLTPTIAVVHWMPPKKLNCVAVTYEVHWKSVTLVNGTQQKGKQFINVTKRIADGRFFTKMNLSLPVQDYLIYVRVYPSNFSDLYNESLSKTAHIYSEPNNITLGGVNINSMNISWISNINMTIFFTIEYKDTAAEKWLTMDYIKMNYNKEIIYHIGNLNSRTLYKFRLIFRYPEYEENFTWPADERFNFSTLGVISNIPEIKKVTEVVPEVTDTNYYLILMLSFIVIVTIIFVCYFYYLHRRGNNEQLLSSTMTDVELAILHEVPCRNAQFNRIYNPMLRCNPDECAITKIARKQITITKRLGSGAFGMVFQGKVKNLERSGTEISVAIKTLRKDASPHEKKNLLKEAKLMSHFRHEHILRLLAVCLDGDSPLLVMELMETGDLLKYLRECRNLQASDSLALRLQDLLAMCEDVARGCCYLEEKRFVHRDLACRNCLVSSRNRENRVIKIGDFGLSRDIYKNDYYRVKEERWFPIRWMAPESLMIEIFTSQSDVWSFGVLMWEITSLGEKPYIDKTDKEVINHVRAGGRLPMTLNCPSPLYQLMLRCWSAADARPNFEFFLKNIIALRENMEDVLLNPVDNI